MPDPVSFRPSPGYQRPQQPDRQSARRRGSKQPGPESVTDPEETEATSPEPEQPATQTDAPEDFVGRHVDIQA